MHKMVKAQVKKWGNSFGVIIPKEVMESEKLKESDEIDFLIIKPNGALKETFGILKGKLKKSAQNMKDELREELYDND